MASYSKTIGQSGIGTGGGIKSLNLTMAADEYPTKVAWGSVVVYVPTTAGASLGFMLCNTSGGNAIQLMNDTYYSQGQGVIDSGSKTVSGSALKGKALAISVDFLNSATFSNTWSFTITTTYSTYSITIINSTGGTVSASATSGIRAGTTIYLSRSASTGYQFSAWNHSPSSVSISSSYTFTMPASNMTISPTWTKINYAITKAVSPSGAGTITSPSGSTSTYGTTITLAQTPVSPYVFDHWNVSSIGNIYSNSFTMPAQAVTITAYYTLSERTLTWDDYGDITLSLSGRILTVTMTGHATDSYGEAVSYYLLKNEVEVAPFIGNIAIITLDESDSGVTNSYGVLAKVDDIAATGLSVMAMYIFPTVSYVPGGYYNGSTYLPGELYYYNGSDFVLCEAKYWNGTSWVNVSTF